MNGIVININPVIFQIGHVELRWYGLAVLAAALAVFLLAVRGAKQNGISSEVIYNLAPWVLVGGVVGARLFHVLDHLTYYMANPAQIIQFQQGGLAIWGALIGGGLAIAIYARAKRISLGLLADILAPALLVGQIIGRLGCIINGDAAGGVTSLPWGFIYTNPASSIASNLLGVPTHPYPVYEMIWNAATLFLVLKLKGRFNKDGMLFAVYLALYALGRLLLTGVRHEAVLFWGLQEAQVLAIGAWAFSAAIVLKLKQRGIPVTEGN
jgi:phosphatidylglycerol:prolipoprotein diacylglycerol transferase